MDGISAFGHTHAQGVIDQGEADEAKQDGYDEQDDAYFANVAIDVFHQVAGVDYIAHSRVFVEERHVALQRIGVGIVGFQVHLERCGDGAAA